MVIGGANCFGQTGHWTRLLFFIAGQPDRKLVRFLAMPSTDEICRAELHVVGNKSLGRIELLLGNDSMVSSRTNVQTVKIRPLKTLNTDATFLGAGSQHECHKCLTTYSYVWRRIGDEELETCNACFLDGDPLACPYCASHTATDGGVMRCCVKCHRLFHRSCEMMFRKQMNAAGICVVCEIEKMLEQRKLRKKITLRKLGPILNHHIFEFANYFKGLQHKKQDLVIGNSSKKPPPSQIASRFDQTWFPGRFPGYVRGMEHNIAAEAYPVKPDARPSYCVLSGSSSGCKVDCWRYPDLLRDSYQGQCIRTFTKSNSAIKPSEAANNFGGWMVLNGSPRPRTTASVEKTHENRRKTFSSIVDAGTSSGVNNLKVSRNIAALSPSRDATFENSARLHTPRSMRLQHDDISSVVNSSERQAYSKVLKVINEDMENMGKEVLDLISANFDVPAQKFAELISQSVHFRSGEVSARSRNESNLMSPPSGKPLDLEKCFDSFKVPLGVISIACVNLFFKVDEKKYRRLPRIQSFLVIMNGFGVYPTLLNTTDMLRIIHNCQMKRSLDKRATPDEAFYTDLRDIIVETAIYVAKKKSAAGTSSESHDQSEDILGLLQHMGLDMDDKMNAFLSQFFSEHAVAQLEKEHREREQWMVEFESAGRSGSPP
jgi:hypothetical protein